MTLLPLADDAELYAVINERGQALAWTVQTWDPSAAVGEFIRRCHKPWSDAEARGYTVQRVFLARVGE